MAASSDMTNDSVPIGSFLGAQQGPIVTKQRPTKVSLFFWFVLWSRLNNAVVWTSTTKELIKSERKERRRGKQSGKDRMTWRSTKREKLSQLTALRIVEKRKMRCVSGPKRW
jgi:hypothetical protein